MLIAQAAPEPMMGIPLGPLLGIVSSVLLLGLLVWGLKNPWVWVIVSVLAIAAGVGCLAWGISQAAMMEQPRRSHEVAETSGIIGGGAGGTAGGVVLLVVALLRCWKRAEKPS